MDNGSLITLSDRLVFALKAINVTQAELARKINVSPQAINYLCKSKATKSQLTYEMAEALGISGDWLANGVGLMNPEDDPQYKLISTQNRIPVLTHQQVKRYCNQHIESFKDENITHWLLTAADTSKQGFAIEIQDKSMYPRFDLGTIIIINPDKKPKNKEFVLAYIDSIDDIIFRQMESNNENTILHPINTTMYKPIILEKSSRIIGTMVEARWQT